MKKFLNVFTVWTSPIPRKSAEQVLVWQSREVPLPCTTERSKYSVKKARERHFLFGFHCLISRLSIFRVAVYRKYRGKVLLRAEETVTIPVQEVPF